VKRGEANIFFRKRTPPFGPATNWVHADDLDSVYQEFQASEAKIIDSLTMKPWALRQFTIVDLDGNVIYFHHS